MMKTSFIHSVMRYFAILLGILVLVGCGNNPPDVAASPSPPAPKPSSTLTLTATPQPSAIQQPKTSTPDFDLTAYYLTNPPPTPTGTPVIDADGNITWHPQKELVSWAENGGDGSDYFRQNFALFWDGTLLQLSSDDQGKPPYITKLNQDEICKILNTVRASGFWDEKRDYDMPFDGLGSSSILASGWQTSNSGAQMLDWAIAGETYYNRLFCRECPIPPENIIIRPGLANIYYFLKNYPSQKHTLAPIEQIQLNISYSEKTSSGTWPVTSISLDEVLKNSHDLGVNSIGMVVDGVTAQEIIHKIPNGFLISRKFFKDYPSIRVSYQVIWPEAPDVPPDATLTCNTKAASYPILPLNKDEKFWYYAPGGKWGAERVEGQNKMRVVNLSGYEKFYSYDPAFFGQASIQIYPRYWSADGQFFYVNILPEPYTPGAPFVNSIGLQQIDVKNEKIKYLFLGAQGQTFTYQFSHDGKKITYIRQGDTPLKLVVVDTYSGEERSVSLTTPKGIPYSSAGTLFWSPKDDKIFLSADYVDGSSKKGDILSIHLDQLADIHVIKQGDQPFDMYDDFSDQYVKVCSGDDCVLLYLDTENIEE